MKMQKTKTKRPAAKRPTGRAAKSAKVTTKQRRKPNIQEMHEQRVAKPTLVIAIPDERTPVPDMSYLFWPTLPFAMMQMWWRTGEATRNQ